MRNLVCLAFMCLASSVLSCSDDKAEPTDAGADAGDAGRDAGPGCANGAVTCTGGQLCCTPDRNPQYPPEGKCEPFCFASDRAIKTGFEPVDRDDVLRKLAALPVQKWSYKSAPGERHIGPMAQDFHGAFALGGDDRSIAAVDANGVTIAAIQAMYVRLEALERETQALRASNARLQRECAAASTR